MLSELSVSFCQWTCEKRPPSKKRPPKTTWKRRNEARGRSARGRRPPEDHQGLPLRRLAQRVPPIGPRGPPQRQAAHRPREVSIILKSLLPQFLIFFKFFFRKIHVGLFARRPLSLLRSLCLSRFGARVKAFA